MPGEFIKIRPPGEAVCSILIVLCRVGIRAGRGGFFKFGITREN
jgi:hypothetical protein